MNYTFQKGEDVLLALEVVSGDPDEVDSITSWMRRTIGGAQSVEAEVAFVPAAGETAAYWTVTVPAAVTKTLPEGLYEIDARLAIGGGTFITDPIRVRLTRSASGELAA